MVYHLNFLIDTITETKINFFFLAMKKIAKISLQVILSSIYKI